MTDDLRQTWPVEQVRFVQDWFLANPDVAVAMTITDLPHADPAETVKIPTAEEYMEVMGPRIRALKVAEDGLRQMTHDWAEHCGDPAAGALLWQAVTLESDLKDFEQQGLSE